MAVQMEFAAAVGKGVREADKMVVLMESYLADKLEGLREINIDEGVRIKICPSNSFLTVNHA